MQADYDTITLARLVAIIQLFNYWLAAQFESKFILKLLFLITCVWTVFFICHPPCLSYFLLVTVIISHGQSSRRVSEDQCTNMEVSVITSYKQASNTDKQEQYVVNLSQRDSRTPYKRDDIAKGILMINSNSSAFLLFLYFLCK